MTAAGRARRANDATPRRSWSSASTAAIACAATPAATSARFPTAQPACARCASTRADASACHAGTSAACSAIRSRRSRSSTPTRVRSPTASACSDATCTAATARTGSRRRRCAIRVAVAPPQRRHARSARRRRGRAGRAASWCPPTTSRSSPRSGQSTCSRRRARAACSPAFVSNGNGTERVLEYLASAHRSVQGRSQELRRPPLPRARRPAAADPGDDRLAAPRGHLGRDRDAARSRASTTATTSCEA